MAASTDTKAKAIPGPVDVLPNDLARLYTHIHPAVLLAAFIYTFPRFVADPVNTLSNSLLPLCALQTAYVAICLPNSVTSTIPAASSDSSSSTKPGLRKKPSKAQQDLGISARVIPAILSLILSLTLGTPLLATGLILFGAPVTTHQFHTMLCAAHLSLLTSLPLIYVHGVDAQRWLLVASLQLPIDEVMGASMGTLAGCWLGAIPIPLDWDREWQRWPITIVAGAYAGYVVGKVLGGYAFKGKVVRLD